MEEVLLVIPPPKRQTFFEVTIMNFQELEDDNDFELNDSNKLTDDEWIELKCCDCEWPLHLMLAGGCPFNQERKLSTGIDCKAFVGLPKKANI
jgi:hypothetical protein